MSSMARLMLLGFALCQGLKHKTEEADECTCINWADAYKEGTGIYCDAGLGDGFGGGEFCGFVSKLHDNSCFHNGFQTQAKYLSYSRCFVSSKCTRQVQRLSTYGIKDFSLKNCDKKSNDKLLVDMPIAESSKIAKENGVDRGVMAGYASVRINKLTKDVSGEELAAIKASGVPTLIWSMADHFADRWQIKDNQVWVHQFSPSTPGYWKVYCKEGCK